MCISIQYLMNRSVFLLRGVRPLSVLPGTELRRVSLTEHVIQGIWIFFGSHPVKNYLDHGFLPFCRLALRFQPDDFCQQIYLLLRQCDIPAVLCTGRRLYRRRLALCRLRCLCFPDAACTLASGVSASSRGVCTSSAASDGAVLATIVLGFFVIPVASSDSVVNEYPDKTRHTPATGTSALSAAEITYALLISSLLSRIVFFSSMLAATMRQMHKVHSIVTSNIFLFILLLSSRMILCELLSHSLFHHTRFFPKVKFPIHKILEKFSLHFPRNAAKSVFCRIQ